MFGVMGVMVLVKEYMLMIMQMCKGPVPQTTVPKHFTVMMMNMQILIMAFISIFIMFMIMSPGRCMIMM
jgi:hypothetical protein